MSNAGKDTIYIDIDDEITAIIEKVRGANEKIVALVLPKRATVLQSIVNMKLLKRTADESKKNLVLITSETGLLPLAGAVGLHVAPSLQSKPVIPKPPESPSDEPEDIDEPLDMVNDEAADDGFDKKENAETPIGQLAGDTAKVAPAIDETFELDNSDGALDGDKSSAKEPKKKRNKKLKIPNFDSFRTKMLLAAGLLVLLIVGWYYAFRVMPKATVIVKTDTTTIPTNLSATVDTAAKKLDPSVNIIPATALTEQKSFSQQVAATGQQNNGQKATGTITMTACVTSPSQLSSVSQGTGVSAGGLTYITQQDANFNFAGACSGSSFKFQASNVGIVAINGGANYNVTSGTFAVSGHSGVTATGSASGGTDNIVKVVTQADIDGAKTKISSNDTTAIKQDLQNNLQSKSLFAVLSTFTAGDPQVTTSAKAGDPTDTVTVTEVITYSMLGVKRDDLKTLVVAQVKNHIDPNKQVILDDGLDTATFTVQNQENPNKFALAISVKSTAGPDVNVDSVKKQVAGKKAGEIRDLLKAIPGVSDVNVKLSPFWVTSVPSNTTKITVQLDKSGS